MNNTHYDDIAPFATKDGSTIREVMRPKRHARRSQSLAEAIVHPGATTALHRHRRSEELYYITRGVGRITLGDDTFAVGPGDTVCIAPGTAHRILHVLCCCAPAYADGDTELL